MTSQDLFGDLRSLTHKDELSRQEQIQLWDLIVLGAQRDDFHETWRPYIEQHKLLTRYPQIHFTPGSQFWDLYFKQTQFMLAVSDDSPSAQWLLGWSCTLGELLCSGKLPELTALSRTARYDNKQLCWSIGIGDTDNLRADTPVILGWALYSGQIKDFKTYQALQKQLQTTDLSAYAPFDTKQTPQSYLISQGNLGMAVLYKGRSFDGLEWEDQRAWETRGLRATHTSNDGYEKWTGPHVVGVKVEEVSAQHDPIRTVDLSVQVDRAADKALKKAKMVDASYMIAVTHAN